MGRHRPARPHRRRAARSARRDGQQCDRRGPAFEGAPRDDRGRLGRDHGRRAARRLPVLQARRPADAHAGAGRRGARADHQPVLAARHGRRARARRLLHREGRRRQPDPPGGGRLRAAGDHRERDRPGQDPDPPGRRARLARGARLLALAHAVRAPGATRRRGRGGASSWRRTSAATSAGRTCSSDARKTAAAATSSGRPSRANGVRASRRAPRASRARRRAASGSCPARSRSR